MSEVVDHGDGDVSAFEEDSEFVERRLERVLDGVAAMRLGLS